MFVWKGIPAMMAPAANLLCHLQSGVPIVRRFAADERGSTATEYAVIAAAIAIGVASGVAVFGAALRTGVYDRIASIFS